MSLGKEVKNIVSLFIFLKEGGSRMVSLVHRKVPEDCVVLRRSKTQGIALSLGDKLILKQKG